MAKMRAAVQDALDGRTGADPRDAAAEQLALAYAEQIDAEPASVANLGTQLLATLAALGLTTAARGQAKGEQKRAEPGNPLDELRARRAARAAG